MPRFYPLTVTEVRPETRDAVVVTLEPEAGDRALFNFTQGQYLTLCRTFDGEELCRPYSICAGTDDGILRVGIKRVEGGRFSTWVNHELRPGCILSVMPPMGRFSTPIEPQAQKHYLGFAAGSGITPVLSIIRTVLSREPLSYFTLVYANRQISSIMFREELDDLKSLHLARLSIIHILKREAQDIKLFTGPIDEDKIAALFENWIDLASVDTTFICGPESMMVTIASALKKRGVASSNIKFELFAAAPRSKGAMAIRTKEAVQDAPLVEVTVTLDGTTRIFLMPKSGMSLLDAAIENHLDAPFSCKAGICSTCKARVVQGEVRMEKNHALEDYEIRAGYVLTCQCHPLSDKLIVTYDE